MFGAVYAYKDNKPSFLVFLGQMTSNSPLVYKGDVYFVVERGQEETVGTFTWSVAESSSEPAVSLTMRSNIFNVTNQILYRGSYSESDKVDLLTGGDWNIVRRSLGISFADLYGISDERYEDDGMTFAAVFDTVDPEKLGVLAYFPPGDGNFYSILIEFLDDVNAFYVFFADNTDMYGRYWLLDPGEDPTGNGSEFRGVVNSLQSSSSGGGGGGQTKTDPMDHKQNGDISVSTSTLQSDLRRIELSEFDRVHSNTKPIFSDTKVKSIHKLLKQKIGNVGDTLN